MKAIQVTFDEALLERLDRHPSVRERGRSAVVREAAAEYLKRQDAEDIARRYRAGYLDTSDLDDELEGWAGEGAWPDEPVVKPPPRRDLAVPVRGAGQAAPGRHPDSPGSPSPAAHCDGRTDHLDDTRVAERGDRRHRRRPEARLRHQPRFTFRRSSSDACSASSAR